MANFQELTVTKASARQPAAEPTELVRKLEMDAALAAKSASDHTHTNDHVPVTLGASNSLALTLDTQAIAGELIPATNGGLLVGVGGASVNFGSGQYQVAPGNHAHANDHVAASANPTQSDSVGVTVAAGQLISAVVNLAANGGLKVVSGQGLAADVGTAGTQVAAGDHTHSVATTIADGAMSAADKIKLDGLTTPVDLVQSVANTATVALVVDGEGELTASVPTGTGLTAGASTLDVDFTAVAAANHTHDLATSTTDGAMSAEDKVKLDALAAPGPNVSIGTSSTLDLACGTDQVLGGDVKLATGSALKITDGLAVDIGTGATQAAAGNHAHANDHFAATANPSQHDTLEVIVNVNQQASGYVRLAANGGLKTVAAQGVAADVGTGSTQVAAGDHTHADASGVAAGLMTAANFTKLAGLPSSAESPLTFADGTTIDFTRTSNSVTAEVKAGAGLTTGEASLEVDFTAVAAADHTHVDATGSASGFLTTTEKAKIADLYTNAEKDARYVLKSGSATTIQAVPTILNATGGDAVTPGLTATNDVWCKSSVYIGGTKDSAIERYGAADLGVDGKWTVTGRVTGGHAKFDYILIQNPDTGNYHRFYPKTEGSLVTGYFDPTPEE
jgi:hypothetical protein